MFHSSVDSYVVFVVGQAARRTYHRARRTTLSKQSCTINSISGLVVEYIVAIDVTRVRFPADASGGMCISRRLGSKEKITHFAMHTARASPYCSSSLPASTYGSPCGVGMATKTPSRWRSSAIGARARVARVSAGYPNQLDYSGGCVYHCLTVHLGVLHGRSRVDNTRDIRHLWDSSPRRESPSASQADARSVWR